MGPGNLAHGHGSIVETAGSERAAGAGRGIAGRRRQGCAGGDVRAGAEERAAMAGEATARA